MAVSSDKKTERAALGIADARSMRAMRA